MTRSDERGRKALGVWPAAAAASLAALVIGIPGALAVLPTECPSGSTRWAAAVSGNWHDSTKWSDGLPGAGRPACIELAGAYVVTASTDVFAQSVFVGSPGAATQPTLKVVAHDVEAAEDIVAYGRLELALVPAPGRTARFLAAGRIAVAAGGTLATSGSGGVLEAPAIEHGGTTAFAVGLTTRGDFVNRGAITIPSGHTLRMEARGGIPQTITFAGGSVNAVGNIQVIGAHAADVNVTGGTLAGDVDLIQIDTLTLAGGSGGEYDIGTAPLQGALTTVSGTIGPTQTVNVGGASTTARTDGLVNNGNLRVFSIGGLGNSGVFLRTVGDAAFTNHGTTTLDGGNLAGTIDNQPGGTITLGAGSGALLSPTLTNRGTIRIPATRNIAVRADGTGPAPAVTLAGGLVEAIGTWSQTGGTVDVTGGTLSGDLDLYGLTRLTLAGGTGGEYDLINVPGGGASPLLNGTIDATQTVVVGTFSVNARTEGLVNDGQLTVRSTGGLGNIGVFLRTLSGATFTNRGTTVLDGGALAGTIANEPPGTITLGAGNGTLLSPTLTNRGTIRIPATRNLALRADGTNPAPIVTLAGGLVDAIGAWSQTGGTVDVTGGTLNGDLDLHGLGRLTLAGGTGGEYDLINVPGGGASPLLNGTIDPTQTVVIGAFSVFARTDGLVNRGRLTVRSAGGLGNQGVFLRSTPGATFTNNAMTTLDGGTLGGAIVNEAGGTIAVAAGSGNLRSPVLTNRGTISVPTGESLDVRADTGGPAPVVAHSGNLDVAGTYRQHGGSFRHLDGQVSATGAVAFTTVGFRGVGTWSRTLALNVGGSLAPGDSPGTLAIGGNYTPSTGTVTQIELGAPEHDRIEVSGTAQLAGTLQVVVPAGFELRPCQVFEVMTWRARTGTFANPGPIDLGSGISVRQVYTPSSLLLVTYEPAAAVNVTPAEVEVSEDGLNDTYDVCVPSAPSGTQTVTITPDDQVTTDVAALAFGAANWQLPQTVTVSAVDDALAEPTPHVGMIAHTASSGAPVATVTALIADNGDAPADAQPPVVTAAPSPAANGAGWNNTDVEVTISADDGPDGTGVAAIHYTLDGVPVTVLGDSATFTITDEGIHELTYSAEDVAGNHAEPEGLTIRIDKTAPDVRSSRAPAPNEQGWNNTDVTATFTGSDALSGIDGPETVDIVVSSEGENQSASHTFRDRAGNEAPATESGISIDKTNPVITGSRTPAANEHGWNNTDVTVTFECSDALSGILDCGPGPQLLSDEGANQSRTGLARDKAGNEAVAAVDGISIDKTPPTLTCSATSDTLWPPNHKLVAVSIAMEVSDALSGPDGFTLTGAESDEPDEGQGVFSGDVRGWESGSPDVEGELRAERDGAGDGRVYTLRYSATDLAGNGSECEATVTVPHDRRGGGG